MIHDYITLALELGPFAFWALAVLLLGLLGAVNRVRIK